MHGLRILDIAATPAIKAVQRTLCFAHLWEGFQGPREFDRFTANTERFIARRDGFYLATTSETGWFQSISVGNLSSSDKACLVLIESFHRARLTIDVHAETVSLDADPQ